MTVLQYDTSGVYIVTHGTEYDTVKYEVNDVYIQ